MSTTLETLVPDRLLRGVVPHDVALLMAGPVGPGRVPAVRGRAVALRVEPSGYRCLAPDGLPSLTRIRSGRRSRLKDGAALSRGRGTRASLSVMRCMTDARLAN